MKIKLIFLFVLICFVVSGQDQNSSPSTDSTQHLLHESTHELYKRLDIKTRGKLLTNKHKFYPNFSSAVSFGKNLVTEEIKPLVKHNNFLSIDFRAAYQTIGQNIYDQLYRFPEWGIGYYGVKLYNDSVFGVPNAVFAYIDIPFNKWNPSKKWTYSYSIGGGLSFNFRPNNPQNNPFNTLIGSYNNVYIDLAFWANYEFNESLDAKIGLSFVHFSNGASHLPNYGMNLIGAKAVIEHNVVRERPEVLIKEIPKWKKKHGVFFYQAFGAKQLSEHGTSYLNTTTSLAYKYWANYKSQLVLQFDAFYDGSNNSGEEPRKMVPIDDRDNPQNLWSLGTFLGYEAVYNRWSFITGWGVYIWRNYKYTNSSYQRFGIRYRIYEGFVIGAGLKARTFAADYIEWSVGYNFF